MIRTASVRHCSQFLCGAIVIGITTGSLLGGQEAAPTVAAKPDAVVYLAISTNRRAPTLPDPSAFSVLVDKQVAQTTSLRPAKNDPLLFAVLIDGSTSEIRNARAIKNAAIAIFDGLTKDGGQGYLVVFNQQVLTPGGPSTPKEARATLSVVNFSGGSALYDTISKTCSGVLSRSANRNHPRRAIFLISDGRDNMSLTKLKEAEDVAEREGVSVFSLTTSIHDPEGGRILQEISQHTGGLAVVDEEDLARGANGLMKAVQDQWVLRIAAPQVGDTSLHSLKVKSAQEGIHISAPASIAFP
jgi:hypothetical protein